jgi:hypothetical protein
MVSLALVLLIPKSVDVGMTLSIQAQVVHNMT